MPQQRFLLLSDGSMTLNLELLTGSKVEVEIRRSGLARLSKNAAAYLEEEQGNPSLEREVWLTAGGKRLIYAQTLIPLNRIEEKLLEALRMEGNEPLGRVLNSKKIPFTKDRLEVGVVSCARASTDLGMDARTPLMARRYVLFNKGDRWVIKAAVTEIFSPDVIGSPCIGN